MRNGGQYGNDPWTNGNDSVNGLDGNDVIYGGLGHDTLNGGNGAARLPGGDGNDYQYGFYGNDTLDGSYGSDSLEGGAGNDSLVGGLNSPDTLIGGQGNSPLRGNGLLNGGTGQDLLYGDQARFVFDDGDSGVGAAARNRISWLRWDNGSKIDLSAVDANTGLLGDQAFKFIGSSKAGAAFTGTGQVMLMAYDTYGKEIHGGNTAISYDVVQMNTGGSLAPDMEIAIEHWTGGNSAVPSASWFIL